MPKFSDEKKMMIEQLLKDKILEEGCKLLEQGNPSLFSMRELAEAVGVSKGTLYNYFADKNEVVFYIDNILGMKGVEEVRGVLENATNYRTALINFMQKALAAFRKYRYVVSALRMIRQEDQFTGKDTASMSVPQRQTKELVIKFLKKGIATGEFKNADPELLDKYITIVLEGINLQYSSCQKIDMTTEETINKILNLFADSICLPGK
ncbi:MAG: TetR/AcrR family transcriptional regulator [Acidaminococcaceae bacterium]